MICSCGGTTREVGGKDAPIRYKKCFACGRVLLLAEGTQRKAQAHAGKAHASVTLPLNLNDLFRRHPND